MEEGGNIEDSKVESYRGKIDLRKYAYSCLYNSHPKMKMRTWVNMKMTEDGRYPNTDLIKASREIIKIAETLTAQ